MVHHVFTRLELYELVWAEAMTKAAKRLGVSDVGLAKACRKADVPVPERGYWAKLASGKPVQKPPLPDRSRVEKRPATEEERRLDPSRKAQHVSVTTDELVPKFKSWRKPDVARRCPR